MGHRQNKEQLGMEKEPPPSRTSANHKQVDAISLKYNQWYFIRLSRKDSKPSFGLIMGLTLPRRPAQVLLSRLIAGFQAPALLALSPN